MDQVKKRQAKKLMSWIVILAAISFLAAMPLFARSEAKGEGPAVSIRSGIVTSGSIETVLRGGGSLAEQEAVKVTVPTGIKLERYLVSNGDVVTAGDAVAEVDPVSVMNTVVQIQEKLDELKQDIADAADTDAVSDLTARAGGRVKIIYAEPGDAVRDVMLEHGSLAVLSLDGRMAVELACDIRFPVGETVTVIFENGAETAGRVENCLDGIVAISVEDEGWAIGETVTVSVGDTVLGTGELYVNNAWNVAAWSGTVEEVAFQPEQTVDAGEVLFTLSNVESTAARDVLAEEHQEYECVLQALLRLCESGVVTAQCDGVVSGIAEDSSLLLENDSALTDFSMDEILILSVIPQDTVTLTITLDERDIGKVSLGQSALVQVDALKGEHYEAVVTAVGTHGTNNGGSSKFTVEMTLDREVEMLAGMRASAGITLDARADVTTIPVAALCELGSQTVVYTGYDSETGALTDPVSVTTGVSDGITVEILTGLKTGDTFYYLYIEGLEDA